MNMRIMEEKKMIEVGSKGYVKILYNNKNHSNNSILLHIVRSAFVIYINYSNIKYSKHYLKNIIYILYERKNGEEKIIPIAFRIH